MRPGSLQERYLWMAIGYAVLIALGLALGSGHPVSWLLALGSVLAVLGWLWGQTRSRS